jgi:hypothetical protein
MVLANEPGQPSLALLVGLSRAIRPVIPGDRLSLRQMAAPPKEPEPLPVLPPVPPPVIVAEPEPSEPPPAPPMVPAPVPPPEPTVELPPPGSLADLERVAKPPTLNATQSAELSRLEAERRWLELSARVLRLPPGSAELTDLQERLRHDLTEHMPSAGDQP